MYKDKKKLALARHRYEASEKGFVTRAIGRMFKPSQIKGRWGKPDKVPECTRQEVWQLLLLHIEKMKIEVPGSDGRICKYCLKPWTYKASINIIGKPQRKKEKNFWTNFSIDRLYAEQTYKVGNIVFCCSKCNAIKNATTKKGWIRYLIVAKEMDEEYGKIL